jgi:hypothetical protein
MPVFELRNDELVPFRRVTPGPELFESEVEDLLWANLEELVGVPLLPLRRQPILPGGGRPDIVALGADGSVFVLEVKRDVDRSQLAQCLEYAGWARRTNLDELAGIYHAGPHAFFEDWQSFTGSSVPVLVSRYPKLVLAARDFHGRTASALEYLQGYDLPVQLLRISFYEDSEGRLVDARRDSGEHDDVVPPPPSPTSSSSAVAGPRAQVARSRQAYGATLGELVAAGKLEPGERLEWNRPQSGVTFRATITEDGQVVLEDGRRFGSPSSAGTAAANLRALNGWVTWRVPRLSGRTLDEIRYEYLADPSRTEPPEP